MANYSKPLYKKNIHKNNNYRFQYFIKICLLLMSILMSCSTIPRKEKTNSASIEEQKIIEMLASGKQNEAENYLEEAITQFPDDQILLFYKAVCTRSRFPPINIADDIFRNTEAMNPKSIYGQVAACVLSLDRHSFIDVNMDTLISIIDKSPNDIMLKWIAGIECRYLGKTKIGAALYEEIVGSWDPGPVLVHQTYANILDDLKEYEKALCHRYLAVKLSPRSWTFDGLAKTQYKAGFYYGAVNSLKKAMELNKNEEQSVWDYFSKNIDSKYFDEYNRDKEIEEMNNPDSNNKYVLLTCAASEKSSAAIKSLFENGYNGNIEDKNEVNALMMASANNNVEKIINVLIQQGIDIKRKTNKGMTALLFAAAKNKKEIIKALLRNGANINDKSNNGWNALLFASTFNHNSSVIEYLLSLGLPINDGAKGNLTPLILATASDNNLEIIKTLLEKGADVSARADYGWTPLMYAAKNDADIKIIDIILEHGAKINDQKNDGMNALMIACNEKSRHDAIRELIKKGADIQMVDNNGRTAFDFAIKNETLADTDLINMLKIQK